MTDHTRREFVAGVGASVTLSAAGAQPAFVHPSNSLTSLASAYVRAESRSGFGSFEYDVRRYSAEPSWTFHADSDDDLDALRSWAEDHDDRHVVREWDAEHRDGGTLTASAPIKHVDDTILNSGVASESFVSLVDLDVQVSNVDRPRLPDDEEFADLGRGTQFALDWFVRESAAPTDGLAWEAEQTRTIGGGRDVVADDANADGSGATLAVIDTGLTYDAGLFGREVDDGDGGTTTEPRVLDASTDYTSADDPTVGTHEDGLDILDDNSGHGSWVTACAAAGSDDPDYRGVAPDADLLILRALDDDGQGSTADIAAAVRNATDEGADAICMSLGSPFLSEDLADALEYAAENDVTIAAASGNDRPATRFANYPASDANTLAVSATTAPADPEDVESAAFANVGPAPGTLDMSNGATAGTEVDLAAPGMDLEANLADGTETLSGTSMATPYVAGAAALLAADGVDEPADRLRETARPVRRLAAAEAENGLLDITAAISGDEPEDDQADVMDDNAEARDAGFRAEADARGRWIATLF